MIVAVSTITEKEDKTKFLQGCLITDKGTINIFYDKEKLWETIIEIGKYDAKLKRKLKVYSHDAQEDFYSYANLQDTNISIQSTNPFIASYKGQKKNGKIGDIIKFYDTQAIWRMGIEELAKKLDETLEKPKIFDENPTIDEMREKEEYIVTKTKIIITSILWIKQKLKEEGILIKNYSTISQIAINYMLNKLSKAGDKKYLFYDQKGQRMHWIQENWAREIKKAQRGGRVEAYQLGEYNNVTYWDANSLFPYSATRIIIPDMRTGRKIKDPLRIYELKDLLDKVGVHNCMIYNDIDEIGIIPIRIGTNNTTYLKKGQYGIGTWTGHEIKYALENGHKIIHIETSIIYEVSEENPFLSYMTQLYDLRQNENDKLNSYFYKMMMNAGIGKLAQKTTKQEYKIDTIEEINNYTKKNWEAIRGVEERILYKKEEKPKIPKPYWNPLIYSYITAKSRTYMHHYLKQVPTKNLLYTDTDSIVFIDDNSFRLKIPQSERMGSFKLEHKKVKAIIYGKKSYAIDEEIHLSGTNTKTNTIEEFMEGTIKNKRLVTIKTVKNNEKIGTYNITERNLHETLIKTREIQQKINEQTILIDDGELKDENCNTIEPFLLFINKIKKEELCYKNI